MTTINSNRFYPLDILRTFAFIAIIVFHTYNFIFWADWNYKNIPFGLNHLILLPQYNIVIGGFVVLAISFFLMGFANKPLSERRPLKILLGLGILLLFVTQGDEPFRDVYLEWDIYHLLIAGLLSLFILDRARSLVYIFGILGFMMLWIPFWEISFFKELPLFWQHPLIGVCDEEGRGGWALLPWIGLIWFSFFIGKIFKTYQEKLKSIPSREEYLGVVAAIFILSPYWGVYRNTPIGYEFACFVHRQSPIHFWSEMFLVFYIMRISLVTRWNETLGHFRLVKWLSDLHLNKKFGQSYLVHLLLLSFASIFREYLNHAETVFSLLMLLMVPMTEFMSRGVSKLILLVGEKISTGKHRKNSA